MRNDIGPASSGPSDHGTPDGVLLDRIARGDERALGELSRRYSVTLYTLAYGILQDPREADRVVARALGELRRDAARGLSAPFPVRWLLTELTRAHALDLSRQRTGERSSSDPPPDRMALPQPPAS